MLYLIIQNDWVKVGYTGKSTLKPREHNYLTHNPDFKGFDDYCDGEYKDENNIHVLMEDDNRFLQLNDTEWFKCLDAELLEIIKTEKLSYFINRVRSKSLKSISIFTTSTEERVSKYKKAWLEECIIRDSLRDELEELKKSYEKIVNQLEDYSLALAMTDGEKYKAIKNKYK